MSKVKTEEILAFCKKIERKLFDISFIDYHYEYTIKRIFSQIFTDSVVEKSLKYQ